MSRGLLRITWFYTCLIKLDFAELSTRTSLRILVSLHQDWSTRLASWPSWTDFKLLLHSRGSNSAIWFQMWNCLKLGYFVVRHLALNLFWSVTKRKWVLRGEKGSGLWGNFVGWKICWISRFKFVFLLLRIRRDQDSDKQ